MKGRLNKVKIYEFDTREEYYEKSVECAHTLISRILQGNLDKNIREIANKIDGKNFLKEGISLYEIAKIALRTAINDAEKQLGGEDLFFTQKKEESNGENNKG